VLEADSIAKRKVWSVAFLFLKIPRPSGTPLKKKGGRGETALGWKYFF